MANFPAHLDATEARIINKALTAALKGDYHIKVIEGEEGEPMTAYTRDRAAIQAEVAATGITVLRLAKPIADKPGKFAPLGNVVLIHGNGEDVISDFSARDDAHLDMIERLIGRPE